MAEVQLARAIGYQVRSINILRPWGDDVHALLVKLAGELAGCTEGSGELEAITDAIDAYEAVRWGIDRTDGG